jgi:hypothetical protein
MSNRDIKPIIKIIAIAVLIGFAFGCATKMTNRRASEFLFSTDRSATNVFSDARQLLEKNKYVITKEDVTAGILVTQPRKYSFEKGGSKISGQQTLRIRLEGGSAKINVTYECNYALDRITFVPCYNEDTASNDKIRRLDPALISILKPILNKATSKATEPASTSKDITMPESTAEEATTNKK